MADAAETVAPAGTTESSFPHGKITYIYNRFRLWRAGCFFNCYIMKKVFYLAVVAAVLVVACSSGNIDEKKAKFQQDLQTIIADFNSAIEEVDADAALTEEEKEAKMQSLYDVAQGKYTDLCLKTIRQNRNNEVGLMAFKEVHGDLEPDEVEKLIATLGPELRKNDYIIGVQNKLEVLKQTAEGKPFVDFEVDGVKFSDFIGKGKWVVVDFWASWCGPCRREVPNLKKVYETYAGPEFDMLSVAVWDKPEDTVKAAAELGIAWNQIINAQKIASDAYGFDSIPQIMLFGPDGTIVKKGIRGAGIEAAVKEALGR